MSLCTILFLAASPRELASVEASREYKTIDAAVHRGRYREHCRLPSQLDLRVSELQTALSRHAPQVLHFCGHGNAAGELQLLDSQTDVTVSVPAKLLAEVLRHSAPEVRCVVLSTCYAEEQARAMVEAGVPFVVGMARTISNEQACAFSDAFYEALAFGKSLQAAFELGRTRLELEKLPADSLLLLARKDSVADRELFFAGISAGGLGFGGSSGNLVPVPIEEAAPQLPPALRQNLALGRELFETHREQMELVRLYKQIHDDFQELEEACRASFGLLEESGRQVPFRYVRDSLRRAESKLESLLRAMRGTKLADDFEGARGILEDARTAIVSAGKAQNTELLTDDLDISLKQTLASELPRTNQRLVEEVRQLNLGRMTTLLVELRTELSAQRPPYRGSKELIARAVAFCEVSDRLTRLLKEHDQWQQVDTRLRYNASNRTMLRKMLRPVWARLTALVSGLCPPAGESADWATELSAQQTALSNQLPGSDDNALVCAFDEYYRLVTQRFSTIDKELLSASGELNDLGRELHGLLEGILQ